MAGVRDIDPNNTEIKLGMLSGPVYVYNPSGHQTSYRIELGQEVRESELEKGTDEYDCYAGREVRIRNRGPERIQVLNLNLP